MRHRVVILILLTITFMHGATDGDYARGEAAYREGAYHTAEVFFRNLLRENPMDVHVPDALFHLVKIYDLRHDMPALLMWAQRFLDDCPYDRRRQDVFALIIDRLAERSAYGLACDFLRQYEFFAVDEARLMEIAAGLMDQGMPGAADSLLAQCPPSDTVNIMRARVAGNIDGQQYFYGLVDGEKGRLYMMELLLAAGDTVQASDIFRAVDTKDIRDGLVRYARIAMLFNEVSFISLLDRLEKDPHHRRKAAFLRALHSGEIEPELVPVDAQECSLLVAALNRQSVRREVFDGIPGKESVSLDSIVALKAAYGRHFVLDSLHAAVLLALGDTAGAFRVTEPYIDHANTARYARSVRGLYHFGAHDYRRAATDLILAQVHEPHVQFILAQALNNIGVDAAYLYERVLESAQDTMLRIGATRELIARQFAQGEYARVTSHDRSFFVEEPVDTVLLRQYIYSLERQGERREAEALCAQYVLIPDDAQMNHYGEYLIQRKDLRRARAYYDSLVASSSGSSVFLYNWALVPFMQGDLDTAQARFQRLVEEYPGTEDSFRAAFKLATILYLDEQFDSAATLYGIAARDPQLAPDALGNQLICYKKSGSWFKVARTGGELLALGLPDDGNGTRFEIGYAWLRAGRPERALEYLRAAVRAYPTPEHYYWLAEAYLAKADFSRALYYYRIIGELFRDDEMWTPTALYKTGIVLEFMGAPDEARAVYQHIIKTLGSADTWGIEAQRRIEYMEQ